MIRLGISERQGAILCNVFSIPNAQVFLTECGERRLFPKKVDIPVRKSREVPRLEAFDLHSEPNILGPFSSGYFMFVFCVVWRCCGSTFFWSAKGNTITCFELLPEGGSGSPGHSV
jgi:hypothetical protein